VPPGSPNTIRGQLKLQPEEIIEAQFVALNEENIDQYIVRPNMKSRTLDAMKAEELCTL
jgi:8-oxo-dGTP diphosphatase